MLELLMQCPSSSNQGVRLLTGGDKTAKENASISTIIKGHGVTIGDGGIPHDVSGESCGIGDFTCQTLGILPLPIHLTASYRQPLEDYLCLSEQIHMP